MKNSWKSLRLYATSPAYVFGIPALILAMMVGVSIIIVLIFGIAVGLPLPETTSNSMHNNVGALSAVPGFMMAVGIMAVTRNFAMALAFGSTRRDFWFGTSLGFVLSSLVTAVSAVGLLGVEKLTHGYGIGAWAFDVTVLGNGNYLVTFVSLFVMSLLSLFLGAFFGTIYRAFGAVATTMAAIGFGLLVVGGIALAVWQRVSLFAWLGDWGVWAGITLGAVLTLVAATGSFAANRLATV
ncbi:MAG: hypothetical protein WAV45_06545 [Propionibacteriaceae bacterium]|nr:hypothetical protein [Micropruina sp.]HBX80904.1 hypothetical protein [Propionibacteriaceae bacterium]HBY22593.1 hypothetical protein [Propionibacteriaceae bacterium]